MPWAVVRKLADGDLDLIGHYVSAVSFDGQFSLKFTLEFHASVLRIWIGIDLFSRSWKDAVILRGKKIFNSSAGSL